MSCWVFNTPKNWLQRIKLWSINFLRVTGYLEYIKSTVKRAQNFNMKMKTKDYQLHVYQIDGWREKSSHISHDVVMSDFLWKWNSNSNGQLVSITSLHVCRSFQLIIIICKTGRESLVFSIMSKNYIERIDIVHLELCGVKVVNKVLKISECVCLRVEKNHHLDD